MRLSEKSSEFEYFSDHESFVMFICVQAQTSFSGIEKSKDVFEIVGICSFTSHLILMNTLKSQEIVIKLKHCFVSPFEFVCNVID